MAEDTQYDYAVIGGGIIGLATARELITRHPGAKVVVLEKESRLAAHQTGHNSGVIHAGVYYAPGSMKARLGVAGRDSMEAFCREHGVRFEICGKLIVAVDASELSALAELERRAQENGVEIVRLSAADVHAIEPHVNCVAGLHSPRTGITDFAEVARKLAELVTAGGGEIRTNSAVTSIAAGDEQVALTVEGGVVSAAFAINCGGLQSDRLARMGGAQPDLRIVPFRGEYHDIGGASAGRVNSLIYPVPDPDFPFLGVHLTRGIDGHVHAGPNAVLATSREGYRKSDFRVRDFKDAVGYRGFWRLAARHPRPGLAEIRRSFSRRAFRKSVQRLVPEIAAKDLSRGGSGVRAQALTTDGRLFDDFAFFESPRMLHVCNAPSPAATASLEIAREIADRVG